MLFVKFLFLCVCVCTRSHMNHDTNQLYMDHTQPPLEVASRVTYCPGSGAGNLFKFESDQYILEINTLLVATFANIFFHSIGCRFSFIYGFLCAANYFKFNQVPFIFAFVSMTLGDRSKNIYCCALCQRVFCLYFPIGSCFTGLQVFNSF